ncbi:MAG: mechanosensitive ion channel [Flavobacteriales bacterium]|jgi:small-conductance mechanosensitive channel
MIVTQMINDFLSKSIQLGSYVLSMERALAVLLTLILGHVTFMLFKWALRRALKLKHIEEGRRFLIVRLMRTLIYVITFFIVIEVLGFNLTVIWAGSAALLVGVGIGLQGFFNDVISGFVLLFEGGVRVGDELEIDGDLVKVKGIALRATRVETVDGDLVVMPNSKIAGNSVMNFSQGLTSTRISVSVGVAYGSDVELVRQLLLEAMTAQPQIVKSPSPQVIFSEFGDSALNFEVRGWVHSPWNRMMIKSDIRFRIDNVFRTNKIKIPFPQRELYITNTAQSDPS